LWDYCTAQTKNKTLEEIAGDFGDKIIVPSSRQAASQIADHGTIDTMDVHHDSKMELGAVDVVVDERSK
jgi:hypothetical protein